MTQAQQDREDAERYRALRAAAAGARVTIEGLDDRHARIEIREAHNRVPADPIVDTDLDTCADRLREKLSHA
jgi:hypothetical protein